MRHDDGGADDDDDDDDATSERTVAPLSGGPKSPNVCNSLVGGRCELHGIAVDLMGLI